MEQRSSHRLVSSISVVAVLTVALVGFFGAPARAQEATIGMQLFGFDPDHLDIQTGTTVVWVNEELFDYPVLDGTHRIVADDGSFDSGDLAPRQRFSVRFLEPGQVGFRCVIHPSLMTGDLSVSGAAVKPEPLEKSVKIVEPSSTDIESWGYRPPDLSVEAGTTVTWRNEGSNVHTVTADDGSFDSGDLQPGETFTYTFDRAVSVRYHCTPHPWMEGLVKVAGAAPPPPPPPPATGSGGGPTTVDQPDRVGNEPATWTVLAVEPAPVPTDWGFEPASLTIRAGDTVVWRNDGSTIHTATANDASFDSGNLDPGGTFQRVFDQTGTFAFACAPHPWMKGTVVVVAADVGVLPDAPKPDGPLAPGDNAGGPPVSPGGSGDHTGGASQTRGAVPLAVGTGGTFGLFGVLLILPALLERARRRGRGDEPAR